MTTVHEYDAIIVGCGIAGLSAGIRAAELGLSVAVIEKSPADSRGGQTRFSESFRVPSTDCDLSAWGYEFAVPEYSPDDFYGDIMDRTEGNADQALARRLVDRAGETIEWLTEHGVEWQMEPLAVGYTAARTWFDNDELMDTLVGRAEELGATFHYKTMVDELLVDEAGRVVGVEARTDAGRERFRGDGVVLAAGGFESSPEMRARYMGAGYDDMKVRGSRYNTGEVVAEAIDVGAAGVGQWSGGHMALIDANAPDYEGGANRVDGYQYGLLVNVDGERFVDEGSDARAHTYARFGREIFEQPRHPAFVILDAERQRLARATGPSDPLEGDTLAELFDRIDSEYGIETDRAVATVEAFNEACDPGEFDPDRLDGNEATAVNPPKSNWAIPLEEAPFYAYPVTGGITFTFGGVKITADAQVVDSRGEVIPGFYAAGNATGGLFFHNYPGGTGLTNGAVYGRIAAERLAAD